MSSPIPGTPKVSPAAHTLLRALICASLYGHYHGADGSLVPGFRAPQQFLTGFNPGSLPKAAWPQPKEAEGKVEGRTRKAGKRECVGSGGEGRACQVQGLPPSA